MARASSSRSAIVVMARLCHRRFDGAMSCRPAQTKPYKWWRRTTSTRTAEERLAGAHERLEGGSERLRLSLPERRGREQRDVFGVPHVAGLDEDLRDVREVQAAEVG